MEMMPGIQVSSIINARYQILSFLGGGLFTEVYRAKDLINDRIVALKIARPGVGDITYRLRSEFYHLTRISHPNIITALDYGITQDKLPFFTMEFFEGLSINRIFPQGFSEELISVAIQVLFGLHHIHSLGLLHSDLKPEHILVSWRQNPNGAKEPIVKILDFGFVEKLSLNLTSPAGTIGYVAPELIKRTGADNRADFYSLGIILYELITQEGPKNYGKNILEWLKIQYEDKILFCEDVIRKKNLPLPPKKFSLLVHSLISGEVSKRPRFAFEIIELLNSLLSTPLSLPKIEEPKKFLHASSFIGRGNILQRLKKAYGEVKSRQGGRLFFILGERGIGKSRLAQEFRFYCQLEQGLILTFSPGSLGGRPQSLLETFLLNLSVYDPSLLSLNISFDELKLQVAPNQIYDLYEKVYNSLAEIAQKNNQPVLILIDDFELFDSQSLEMLRYLGLSLDKDKVFMLVCGLPEKRLFDLAEVFSKKPYFTLLTLDPLSREETTLLISSLLGEVENLEEFGYWIFQTSGGNPLFINEIIYSLIDQQLLTLKHGRWTIDIERLASLSFPHSTTDVVKQRLKKLTPEEYEILKVGAILGRPFSLDFLRKYSDFDEKLLFSAVINLQNTGFLKLILDWPNHKYFLTSKILEAVIQERLSQQERQILHQKIAFALELLHPEDKEKILLDLAFHYAQAQLAEPAFKYSALAYEKAKSLSLTKEALSFCESNLHFLPKTAKNAERLRLMEEIGRLREILGLYREAVDIYKQALGVVTADKEMATDKKILIRLLERQGIVYQLLGNYDEAIKYFDEALSMEKEKDSETTIKLLCDLGFTKAKKGDKKDAEAILEKAISLSSNLKLETQKRLKARIYYYLAILYYEKGKLEEAIRLIKNSIETGAEVGIDPLVLDRFIQFYGTLLIAQGQLEKAKELFSSSYEFSKKVQAVNQLITSEIGLGTISVSEGDYEKAREYFESALNKAKRIDDKESQRILLNNLAGIYSNLDWVKTENVCQEIISLYQNEIKDSTYLIAIFNYIEILLKMGRFSEGEKLLNSLENDAYNEILLDLPFYIAKLKTLYFSGLNRMREAESCFFELERYASIFKKNEDLDYLPFATHYNLLSGNFIKAKEYANKMLEKVEGEQNSKEYGEALRTLGLYEMLSNRVEEGKEKLLRSLNLFKKLNFKYELGLTFLYFVAGYKKSPETIAPLLNEDFEFRNLDSKDFQALKSYLSEARQIFEYFEAKTDLAKVKLLEDKLAIFETSGTLKSQEKHQYLKVFYQISELINIGIEKEDFFERIIDLTIDATGAERGVLFLLHGDKLTSVTARAIDHTTLEDATKISMSAIKRLRYTPEPVLVSDALNDPRFKNAPSVILNKIRSLLCVPLRTEEKIIGAIYLDSRITSHLFLDEDKNLLVSIANLLAATIDKSLVFKKIQQDISLLRDEILIDATTGYFLGKSKVMRSVYDLIDKVAPTECTILLLGETGTGKNILARYIHNKSPRRNKKFVSINCGTLPETLFESELFGHIKGAFTGAIRDKEGLFEIADGGTIFMDEIANISMGTQARLLEVLEEKIIRRVGDTEQRRVDVRLICATNKNLEEEIRKNNFREDLYYRLNVVTITVPPLRERMQDVPYLANYFLKRYAQQLNKPVVGFEEDVIPVLLEYSWPGNIRELQNVIERAVIMAQKKKISIENLGPKFTELAKEIVIEKQERKTITPEDIIQALKNTRGNVSRAAKSLQTYRRHLQRLMKRYNIDRTQFKEAQ